MALSVGMNIWTRRTLWFVYDLIWWILTPLLPFILIYLVVRGKDVSSRVNERLALSGATRPAGKLVWLHGSSVGETRSVVLLLQEILKQNQSWSVLLTTSTITAYERYKTLLPDNVCHVLVPFDHPILIALFRRHWRPDAVIWCEQDLWPNIMRKLVKRVKGRRLLIQARFSPTSLRNWSRAPSLLIDLLSCFSKIYTQSSSMCLSLRKRGIQQASYVGNLKRFALPESDNANGTGQHDISRNRDIVGSRPAWIGLSLHPEDIAGMSACHSQLKKLMPQAMAIWVLRYPQTWRRAKTVAESDGHKINAWDEDDSVVDGSILVWRTMGGLEQVFSQSAKVCVIGGSFHSSIGGHNPFEPLHYQKMIVFGPHMENFQDDVEALLENKLAMQIMGYDDLPAAVMSKWNNEDNVARGISKAETKAKAKAKAKASALQVIVKEFYS